MDSNTSMSNDRSRTYWSPLTERYFIDLMLEHLHRGNKVGHTFNKEAWTDMKTMFNAKFGSQYDKDVLKSHYASLWNKFIDVKNILSHNEFSWDGSYQMVVADEFVWDAYIKVHPNAQCYRTKSVLNFEELCEIFGYTTADGRYSLSSHDVSIDVEVRGLNLVDGMEKTVWTTAMDQFFVKLLLEQCHGKEVNNGVSKKAWTDMVTVFNANFGSQHGKNVLRNRYRKLLKYFCEMKIILKKQGFSWDSQKQMLGADDDVWDAYIKEHPYARKYKLNIYPNYYDLELIFRNVSREEFSNLHQKKKRKVVATKKKWGDRKGKGNPSGGANRSRTFWTIAMDRCFIDLLLEQVKNGNKPADQKFTANAWNSITKSFNERLKSQKSKEVLRTRYKYLKKQFNDVHNILQHSGFSWDDTTEMVSAEDHVWDAYIKVHPEAQSIRIRNLSGYRKLCVIFGKGSSDTRNFSLSENADLTDESLILITEGLLNEIGEQNSNFMLFEQIINDVEGISSNLAIDRGEEDGNFPDVYDDASPIEWTESMECFFIDLMIEQVNKGNKVRYSFNEEAWTHMTKAFSTRLGVQSDKKFLEDHYFCLMKRHENITNLLNQGGFALDEILKMTLAKNDFGEAYLKDKPEAILLKNTSLYRFNALCKIFGNKISNERVGDIGQRLQFMEANHTTNEMDMNGTYENLLVVSNAEKSNRDAKRLREMDIDIDMEMDGTSENLVVIGNTEISHLDKKRPCSMLSSSNHTKESPKKDLKMMETSSNMEGSVKAVAVTNMKEDNIKSFQNALSGLLALPDMDEELVMDACDFLEDEKKALTFLALDVNLRKKWLVRKLRP